MADIQIDMFDVQLGAAILLQLQVDGRPVRILADAGIKASGYSDTHVLRRLLPILEDSGDLHIDLVIGTHYDEDHLNGLVPIIRHEGITIGEAWMPPVANDSQLHPLDGAFSAGDLLANQFYEDEEGVVLSRYLQAKRADIETLLVLEGRRELHNEQSLNAFRSRLLSEQVRRDSDGIGFFREQLDASEAPDQSDHAAEVEAEISPEVEQAIAAARRAPMTGEPFWDDFPPPFALDCQMRIARRIADLSPEAAAAQMLSFGDIRKSSAKDAINAVALHEVVTALRDKDVPVRTEIIEDGEPRRYAWRGDLRRFLPAARGGEEPILTLLGPSSGLVRKHWNRLPVEQSARVALSFLAPIKSITPSNQLSYIMRLSHRSQGILVSGDAGCVDFKLNRSDYHPRLLAAMLPLHVLQVAHHGGNNAHFYRVLEAAGYPEQPDHSYLLLSHATNDRYRPSDEFRLFLLGTLDRGDDVRLLFTAQPKAERSRDFAGAFHPVVGGRDDRGDVRIIFKDGAWDVKSHAIAP
jgi:beta-lactamase superfamily II metal-dependent hydrolase